MSSRSCNYCTYESMKREARKLGEKLRTCVDPSHGHSCIVVERAKKGTKDWRPAGTTFMALGDHCEC